MVREDPGYLRVAVVTPELALGNPAANAALTIAALKMAAADGVRLAVFPELGLTGYSCGDLFFDTALRAGARAALTTVVRATRNLEIAAVVGLPLEFDGRLYNCAALVASGYVVGVVPKSYLPNRGEFYEGRWFNPAIGYEADLTPLQRRMLVLDGQSVPFGPDLLFTVRNLEGAILAIEICEDLWALEPPSGHLAAAGATIIANLSASDELLGKTAYREELVRNQSARTLSAYLYAAAGPGESSSELLYAGDSMIYENGHQLGAAERFRFATQIATADLDLLRLANERLHHSSFSQAGDTPAARRPLRRISFTLPGRPAPISELRRSIDAHPFVPADPTVRAASCQEIFAICTTALARRLRQTQSRQIVFGLSGGLDSTLALLFAARAFDLTARPRDGILALTLPGPATSSATLANARTLANALGVTLAEISIGAALAAHLAQLGHDGVTPDRVYQNAQARERTQILLDKANQVGGFMLGTGDLSEIALGWSTYGGDQTSAYHINAGIPKTLVRYLVEWAAGEPEFAAAAETLRAVLATVISPELAPADATGRLQSSEELIGPYELHDFFLYQLVRAGFGPTRIFDLATRAFAGSYQPAEILAWLRVFYARFFAAQFKRQAAPDGPKVGTVALSPRADWRMPADLPADFWLAEIDALALELAREAKRADESA